jgi:hypothetical protein
MLSNHHLYGFDEENIIGNVTGLQLGDSTQYGMFGGLGAGRK